MHNDEQAIRDLIASWMEASASGDLECLRELMADDVVFLTPGQPPMQGREAFMAAFQEGLRHFRIDAHSQIKEIHVAGDFAYCWTRLAVTTEPRNDGLPMRRSGNTLSILKKQSSGRWVIVRDANMLMPEPA